MSDDTTEVGAEAEGPKRKDYTGAKRGRKPKAAASTRSDSPQAPQPINGWGDPFKIECAPGWMACWAKDADLDSMSYRPWTAATWGDPRVVSYRGQREGTRGQPIKFKELHCYLMREDLWQQMHANDPNRQVHRDRINSSILEAANSEAGGHRGYATASTTTTR